MIFKYQLFELVFLFTIFGDFATDGSLLNNTYGNNVSVNIKGHSEPANSRDTKFTKRTLNTEKNWFISTRSTLEPKSLYSKSKNNYWNEIPSSPANKKPIKDPSKNENKIRVYRTKDIVINMTTTTATKKSVKSEKPFITRTYFISSTMKIRKKDQIHPFLFSYQKNSDLFSKINNERFITSFEKTNIKNKYKLIPKSIITNGLKANKTSEIKQQSIRFPKDIMSNLISPRQKTKYSEKSIRQESPLHKENENSHQSQYTLLITTMPLKNVYSQSLLTHEESKSNSSIKELLNTSESSTQMENDKATENKSLIDNSDLLQVNKENLSLSEIYSHATATMPDKQSGAPDNKQTSPDGEIKTEFTNGSEDMKINENIIRSSGTVTESRVTSNSVAMNRNSNNNHYSTDSSTIKNTYKNISAKPHDFILLNVSSTESTENPDFLSLKENLTSSEKNYTYLSGDTFIKETTNSSTSSYISFSVLPSSSDFSKNDENNFTSKISDHDKLQNMTNTNETFLSSNMSYSESTGNLTNTTVSEEVDDIELNNSLSKFDIKYSSVIDNNNYTTLFPKKSFSIHHSTLKYTEKIDQKEILNNNTPQRNDTIIHIDTITNETVEELSSSFEDGLSNNNNISKTPPSSETNTSNSNYLDNLRQKISSNRIEISENDIQNAYWICPPLSEPFPMDFVEYQWYKLSKFGSYRSPLKCKRESVTNRSLLEIKVINSSHEGRYFCIQKKNELFHSTEIFFYQIIILRQRWINIGSVDTVTLYFNQNAIMNCPYGNIIKNNASLGNTICSGRIIIKEESCYKFKDVYRCSNSDKITVKMPATSSSNNCSLDLNACSYTDTKTLGRRYQIFNVDRCDFLNNTKMKQFQILKKCPGKIFIRYYFDNVKSNCFPFETNICDDDYYTFSSLKVCQETCVKISQDLKQCFFPLNTDRSEECSSLDSKGKYNVTYNIETNTCKWFYHCQKFPLSKNIFKSISECNKICVQNENSIKLESIKACNYHESGNNGSELENHSKTIRTMWVFIKQLKTCELRNISSENEQFFLYFTSKQKCESICKIISSDEICLTRPENGECIPNKTIKWHFNIKEGRCIKILDRGCGTSLNRFNSKSLCEEICKKYLLFETIPSTSSIKSTKMYPTIQSTSKTSIRRRIHRRISPQYLYSTKPSVTVSKIKKIEKYSSIIERSLDFDPCFKEALKGSCDYGFRRKNYQMIRYSFNHKIGRCVQVSFSGCKSGENLFDDANDCKAACEYRLHQSLKSPSCSNPFLQNCVSPNNVKDKGKLKRFFFLPLNGNCESFTSVNSSDCLNQYFTSTGQCKQMCVPKPPLEKMLQNRCFGKVVVSDSSCAPDQKINLWFFMVKINQCLQYSTCAVETDGNVFLTKVDCEYACKATNILTVCGLPMDRGRGYDNKGRYYYDSKIGKCRLFFYKGSLGNLNRFKTRKECEKACSDPMRYTDAIKYSSLTFNFEHEKDYKVANTKELWLNDKADKEYCFDSHRYGGCSSVNPQIFIKKFYYDSHRKQCEPYMFSGCGSVSRNSFDSISICDKICTERVSKTTSSLCTQKVSKCSDSQWMYWTYNSERGFCEPFSSCIQKSADQFFFTDEQNCSQICKPQLPHKKDLFDICHLPPSTNENCSITTERWYYEENTQSCYSLLSCEQYGNNFPSLKSCLSTCEPKDLKDICQLPVDKGPCNNNISKFYFDWKSQSCKWFSYGGCLGNRNRFQTYEECDQICLAKNRCNFKNNNNVNCEIPIDIDTSNYYFYDKNKNKCQSGVDSFCEDYRQLFQSKENCDVHCVVPNDLQNIIFKEKPKRKFLYAGCGHSLRFNTYPICLKSDEWLPRFYYDQYQDKCNFFYYNGCNGTEDFGNRFTSVSDCEVNCKFQNTRTESILSMSSVKPVNFTKFSSKHGICPGPYHSCSQLENQYIKCDIDEHCFGSLKCCNCQSNQQMISVCLEPLSCMTTEYGCCGDGITIAVDQYHQNCNPQNVIIDSTLPEIIVKNLEEELTLNCYAYGSPKPNITWIYFGNTIKKYPENSKWDLIKPKWSATVRIPSTQKTYGLWSCLAVNDGGFDEREIFVNESAFNITFLRIYSLDKSSNVTINATLNHQLVLHCPIYGIPRPKIIWFHERMIVTESSKTLLVFNRHIKIKNISLIHEGIWKCIAENQIGSLSYKIKLNVLEPLKIVPPLGGTKIKATYGKKIILFCDVRVEGDRVIKWYLDTIDQPSLSNLTSEGNSRILIISFFEKKYFTTIVCEAYNKINRKILKFFIVPYNSNDIIVNPSGILFVGMTVKLLCPIKSTENITKILWKKNQKLIKEETVEIQTTLNSISDSGYYSCQNNGRRFMTYLFVQDNL